MGEDSVKFTSEPCFYPGESTHGKAVSLALQAGILGVSLRSDYNYHDMGKSSKTSFCLFPQLRKGDGSSSSAFLSISVTV